MDAKPHIVCRNPLAVEVRKSAMPRTSISRVGLLSYPYLSSTDLDQFSSVGQHSSKWREHMIKNPAANLDMNKHNSKSETAKTLLERFSELDREAGISKQDSEEDLDRRSSVRKAMSLNRNAPPGPPPLCSICQHKAPVFGKPPRWFSYSELEHVTNGFSQANFLAEGGFGSVHRGILPDGQAVAVKQHKLASSQGDLEFCSEVEVLSCAQHRNVVMLIGYCIEDKRRLLVYEYVCNGSLDSHLYGRGRETLEWIARQKIAIGAARGLNYKAAQRHDFSERMSREDFVEGKKAGKYKGVKRNYLGHFTTQISDSIAKKWRWLGTFDTPEEVAAAYANAAAEMKERRSQMNSESCSLSASSHPDIHIIKREQCFNRAELDSKTERIDCKTYLLSLKNTASSFTWMPTFKSMTTLINSLISCAFAAEQETMKPISSVHRKATGCFFSAKRGSDSAVILYSKLCCCFILRLVIDLPHALILQTLHVWLRITNRDHFKAGRCSHANYGFDTALQGLFDTAGRC